MNAALAKPIPELLVYSSQGAGKALISIEHLLRCRRLRCAALRVCPSSSTGTGGNRSIVHCTIGVTHGQRKHGASLILGPQCLALASPASLTSILRNSVPLVTRSGKSSRSVAASGLHIHAIRIAARAGPVGVAGAESSCRIEVHRLAMIFVHVRAPRPARLAVVPRHRRYRSGIAAAEVDDPAKAGDQMGGEQMRSGRTKSP